RLLPAASCCPECGGSLSYPGEDAAGTAGVDAQRLPGYPDCT
ncbi:putative transposase, partial [Shigella dysenteriae 225-75]